VTEEKQQKAGEEDVEEVTTEIVSANRNVATTSAGCSNVPISRSSDVPISSSSDGGSQPLVERTWWTIHFDNTVLDLDLFGEMKLMWEGGESKFRGAPLAQLGWLLFGYVESVEEYQGIWQQFQGWPHEGPKDCEDAGKLASAMNKLYQLALQSNTPVQVSIAKALRRAMQILAGGHVPPSLHVSHACMVGIRTDEQKHWAIPRYQDKQQILRVGKDMVRAVCNLLECFGLRETPKPAAPTFDSVANYRSLKKSKAELNWEHIMHNPGARQAFYNATGNPEPHTIETFPSNTKFALDNFCAFWEMDHFMNDCDFEWRDAIDTAMLPMDIANPKGAECPRTHSHRPKETKRER
jgi:hypothetical protein